MTQTPKFTIDTPVQYRNGRPAKLLAVGLKKNDYPIVAVGFPDGNGVELVTNHTDSGSFYRCPGENPYDLIPIPQPPKRRPWRVGEIPVMRALRYRVNDSIVRYPLSINIDEVEVSSTDRGETCTASAWLTAEQLAADFDYTLDGETWLSCDKEEKE